MNRLRRLSAHPPAGPRRRRARRARRRRRDRRGGPQLRRPDAAGQAAGAGRCATALTAPDGRRRQRAHRVHQQADRLARACRARNPILTGANGRAVGQRRRQGAPRAAVQLRRGRPDRLIDGTHGLGLRRGRQHRLPHDAAGRTPARRPSAEQAGPPTLAQIEQRLAESRRTPTCRGAIPGNVAGRPAYTVEVSPKHDAGLLGGAAGRLGRRARRAAAGRRLRRRP